MITASRRERRLGFAHAGADHDPRQGIAGGNPAERQFFGRIGIMEVEPGFRLGIQPPFGHTCA